MCHKTKLKFQDYTIFLEANQLENEISHLKKINIEVPKRYNQSILEKCIRTEQVKT